MTIADPVNVRTLAGNRSIEILPESDITQAIEFSDSLVQSATTKTNWDITDPGYNVIKKASEFFASSSLLSGVQDAEEDAKKQWDYGDYLIKTLVANLGTATAGEEAGNIVNIESGVYQTFPLNPSAPYRRPNGRGNVYEAGERLWRYDV